MELLVVIATIGILGVMLLPALTRTQQHAKTAVCLGNYHHIGFAVALFAEDNHKYPGKLGGHEIAKEFACNMTDEQRFREMTNRPLFQYINPYSEVFHCPDDKGRDFRPEGPFYGPTLHHAFGCSYQFNAAPWENTLLPPKGLLPGKPIGWVDRPNLYIMSYEPPVRPRHKVIFDPYALVPDVCRTIVIVYPYNYFHWHLRTGKDSIFDIANDDQKAISPILFVDGHAAKHDFTRALRKNPRFPTEPTKDWIWYEPRPGAIVTTTQVN